MKQSEKDENEDMGITDEKWTAVYSLVVDVSEEGKGVESEKEGAGRRKGKGKS